MRLASLLPIGLLVATTLTHADTILVGTDLSTATQGGAAVLCPGGSDCSNRASQFTFSTSVVVNSISVVITATDLGFPANGNFTIGLGSQLGVGVTAGIGAGDLVLDPGQDTATKEFTFSGLDLSLTAGTYYLGMAGGNVEWDYAEPVSTTAGTLGLQLSCDPFIYCGNDITRWDTLQSRTYAMEIDGTTVPAPEPSAFALLGTGTLVLAGVARHSSRDCV